MSRLAIFAVAELLVLETFQTTLAFMKGDKTQQHKHNFVGSEIFRTTTGCGLLLVYRVAGRGSLYSGYTWWFRRSEVRQRL